MKHKLILTLAAVALVLPLHARTWTSASGKNQFEGNYVSSTETAVTVIKNGRQRTFKLELLSEDDKKWITEEKERLATVAKEEVAQGSIKDQKIGKKLIGKTVRVMGKKYVAQDTEKVPEYYFLYFSAST